MLTLHQKNLFLVLSILGLPLFQSSYLAASDLIGMKAPYFKVQSGDGKELSSDMIGGKVTTIFYENKDIVSANQRLKDELKKLYAEQTDTLKELVVRLPVIDCSDAALPTRWLWRRKLREYAKKEGMHIYCDWNGKILSDYKMKAM
jgi:hypothetical protein